MLDTILKKKRIGRNYVQSVNFLTYDSRFLIAPIMKLLLHLQGAKGDKRFTISGLVGGKSYGITVVLQVCSSIAQSQIVSNLTPSAIVGRLTPLILLSRIN